MTEFTFPTDLKYVKQASSKVINEFADLALDEKTLIDIKLCFEEAYINAIRHGNKSDPNLSVEVEVIKTAEFVKIIICDKGEGFDIDKCKDPTQEENLKKMGGRGVFMMKKFMDELIYDNKTKCLMMKKKINS